MRLNGLGAGTSVFSARYVGLRHDPRNRRPRQPHVHGCQPRRQPSGDPRRGDHLRLHGPRFLEETDPSGRKDADHRHLRPRQPPRLIHQGAVGLPLRRSGKSPRSPCRGASSRTKTVEGSTPSMPAEGCGSLDAQRLLYIYPGRQVQAAIGYANLRKRPVRLELRPETTGGRFRTDFNIETDRAGRTGEISFTYLIPADKPRYGTVRDALEVLIDRPGATAERSSPTASASTRSPRMQHKNARKPIFSENILKFGPVKHAGPVRKSTLRFRTRAARS